MRYRLTRLLVLIAATTLVAACGDGDDAQPTHDQGYDPDGGADAATPPELTLSLEGSAVPEVGDEVAIRALVSNSSAPVSTHTWEVTGPNGKVDVKKNTHGDRITFTPKKPGTYDVKCELTLTSGETLTDSASVQVDTDGKKLTYTARIIPSPVSELPPVDKVVQVGVVSRTVNWQVVAGQVVRVDVTNGSGQKIPSVVRLIQTSAQDPLPRDIYLESGSGDVRVSGVFHALFLPQGSTLAADLRAANTAGSLPGVWPVELDQGVEVTGSVTDSTGAGLAGVKVTMHTRKNGILVPSSIGTTDSQGAFSVRGRAGDAMLTVVPPADTGLPVAVVDSPKLVVSGPKVTGWTFKFAKAKPVMVTGAVTESNNKDPAVGAKVVMTAALKTPAVGTMTAPETLNASGLYNRELTTDANGDLVDKKSGAKQITVPEGSYQVAVWPGAKAAVKEGYVLSMQNLVQGSSKLSLKLASRATLTGKVEDQDGKPVQARVVAAAQTGSFATTSDHATGVFSLHLNNNASYSLVIRSASKKVSTYIDPLLEITGNKTLATIQLPPAVLLKGQVTTEQNLAIAGSLVRIWCSGADCPSHEIVDEVTIGPDGLFELRVPPTPPE